LLAKVVNDDVFILNKRVVLAFFASKLGSYTESGTISVTIQ